MQAEEFQRMVLEDAMDDQGFVRHHLRADRRPLTDSDLLKERTDREERIATGKECHPLLGSPAYAMYEDANYCGNRFLMAMVWRQLALGPADRAGKVATDRAYQASILPARLGAGLDRGYWPKPCTYINPISSVHFVSGVDMILVLRPRKTIVGILCCIQMVGCGVSTQSEWATPKHR